MKVFVPASCSFDSMGLLYYLLTTTEDEVITRLFPFDANTQQVEKYTECCEWLVTNTRSFDYSIYTTELPYGNDSEGISFKYFDEMKKSRKADKVIKKAYYTAHCAKEFGVDKTITAHNTSNYSLTNIFYNVSWETNSKSLWESYYQNTDIPLEAPFMEQEIGKYQIYEMTPDGLKNLIPIGSQLRQDAIEWYNKKISEGLTTQQIDDLVMKEGKYGKYINEADLPESYFLDKWNYVVNYQAKKYNDN